MAVKIIRKPSRVYRAECPTCYALLEYNFVDAETGAIKCPCCSTYIDHRTYGTPIKESEGEK